MNNRHAITTGEFLFADAITLLLEGAVYFVSLAGPVWTLWRFRTGNPLVLLAVAIAGYVFAAFVFGLVLVLLRRALFPRIAAGQFLMRSPRALPQMLSGRLMAMMERSPFASLIRENAWLRIAFYRGMGAAIDGTFVLVGGSIVADPWLFTAGRNCLVGAGACVSCHAAQKNVVIVEPVTLGDNVVIGARAFVSPGVRIGSNAIVAAGAFVPRRTVIGEDEVWAGNPAVKVDLFAAARAAVSEPSPELGAVAAVPEPRA